VHILFASVPIGGHVHPLVTVARELVARGHQLTWYTGAAYAHTVRGAGARFAPYRHARDFDDAHIERSFPGRARHRGLAQLKFDLKHVFIAQAPGQLRDLEELAAAERPDLILADTTMLGALLFKQKTGTPLILINVVAYPMRSRGVPPFGLGLLPSTRVYAPLRDRALHALVSRVLFADVQRHWERMRRTQGLPTERMLFDAALDATWFIQPTVPSFEYPRTEWPANVRLVGALHRVGDPLPAHEALLAELPRPLVHVTQGTTSNMSPTLIAPALAALAEEPVGVLVATGGRSEAELGVEHVPRNARVVSLISYPALLPQTAVMVTNGGYGGVQLALAHGVPLVVWGSSEDKPETAARVEWAGVGVRLSGSRPPRPDELRAAVREVLANARYRARARALASEYARSDAARTVADLSEQTLRAAREPTGGARPSPHR
jgi:MGT family glycosyltransferase